MPLSDPIYNKFKLHIPPNWFYPEVVNAVWKSLRQLDLPFESVEAYMNSTVINGLIPGLKDDGSGKQISSTERTRAYKGSLLPKENVGKTINVSFKLKDNFLNWIIFYKQALTYLDHNAGHDRVFLPPIYMNIQDDYGNNIINLIYREIRIQEVPSLDFTKQDRGIITRDFQITFAFNDFDIEFELNRTINHTKPEYQY